MIAADEIRRLAGAWKTDLTTVERDYVLSWVLKGLCGQQLLADHLVFKGGTALRKCYFPEYRFSADLDFTLRGSLAPQALRSEIDAGCQRTSRETGLQLALVDFRTVRDVPGEEAHQGRVEYIGPLGRMGGSQPRIRLDLTAYEKLVQPPESRPVHHAYSDAERLGLSVPTYSLEEMLAEKLRAMLRRSRARDLYDVWQLLTSYAHTIDLERARNVLTEKTRYKGYAFSGAHDFLSPQNLRVWAGSWEASLRRQVFDLKPYDEVTAEVERTLTRFLTSA